MKFVPLTIYFAAAISFAVAAEKFKSPKWIHTVNPHINASIQGQNLDSRSTCDTQKFTSCMLTFFGHFGLSNTTLPSEDDLNSKFWPVLDWNDYQKFQELCGYMNEVTNCAPSSDCWTRDSMGQLNFPNGTDEAYGLLFILLPAQALCNDYNSVLKNWDCLMNNHDNDICTSMDNNNATCADAEAFFTCDRNYWSKQCNSDVAKISCHVYIATMKALNTNPCHANELDNVCDKGTSTTGGSTIAPNSTTPNTGSLNDGSYSTVLAIFIALSVTSLKHA